MKKILGLTLLLSLVLTLTACGQTGQNETSTMAEMTESTQGSELSPENGSSEQSTGEETTMKAEFNFETKTVMLNSGYEMPINGLGTYSLHDDVCINSVTAALNSGVRLIDTAHAYGNEKEIGEAIRNSGIPREEIFVITKIYPDQFSDPEAAIDEALEKLDIGYIDMILLHHPGTGDVEAYHAMEQAVADGTIRSIGLSN